MDYQALGVGLAALVTAIGTVIAGIYTGNNSRARDKDDARTHLEQMRLASDIAVEEAAKARVEALALDASEARKRARELEDEFDERYSTMRKHAQRGWDLASYHFGLVAFLSHLLNNIFMCITLKSDPETVVDVTKNAMARMKTVTIPVSLESPLEDREARK